MIDIRQGDCRALMAEMPAASVDAIVTDPPYHLTAVSRNGSPRNNDTATPFGRTRLGSVGFMGKTWDGGDTAHDPRLWAAALRVAKPGGHLVAFGGTRTYHRLACALEDAGWEIRDCLSWLYGSGFPKSLDVSKAIHKAAGQSRPVVGPASEAARTWQGWGTALKPAWEPIILARKPLAGTVAANVQEHGTGALNIDGCRIEMREGDATGYWPSDHAGASQGVPGYGGGFSTGGRRNDLGRWPANVILDAVAAELLDEQTGELTSGLMRAGTEREGIGYRGGLGTRVAHDTHGDRGGASRFFYTAKASSSERHAAGQNTHPTVKPVDLMRWLCRLVTPPGGLILDPFTGSGSTGVAALAEGFRFIGCELNAEYVQMARRRIAGPLFAEGVTP